MLNFLFHVLIALDRLLASRAQRGDAEWHSLYAQARHGRRAVDHLNDLLRDPRRRRSRRAIRLAVADVIRRERRRA